MASPSSLARAARAAAVVTGPGRRAAWRRRVARKIVALVLAAGAVLAVVTALRPAEPERRVDVPVAARALAAGTRLTAGDVRTVSVPVSLAGTAGSAGAPMSAESSGTDGGPAGSPVGRLLAGAVEEGEPLRASRLLGPGLAARLGSGEVAVAVPLQSRAVADAVEVGSRVELAVAGRVLSAGARVVALTRASGAAGQESLVVGPGAGASAEALVAVRSVDAPALTASSSDSMSPAAIDVILVPQRGDHRSDTSPESPGS